ncbi:MAG: fibronectin type III domain-containing protein [candidate division Zixibacteria bacterium]|nr:fibronectin type III domain-containing protein [candidate division Zixibacteria bacterium]
MKTRVITALVIIPVLAVSCSRYIESRHPVGSVPEAGPVPYNVQVLMNNGSVTLTWEMADTAAVSKYRIYAADSTGADYLPVDSTTELQVSISNLLVNRKYFFRIASVSGAGLESPRSEAVSARVSFLSITISDNNEFINTRDVLVGINGPPTVTHVILSEDPAFGDAVFQAYAPLKNFLLSDGDGEKTVYGKLQFADGSESGELLSDDIMLDTRTFIESVSFSPSGITFSTGDTVYFQVTAGETRGLAWVSFTGVSRVNLYDDGTGSDNTGNDRIYSGYYVVQSGFNLLDGMVTGGFTDAAGNTADPVVATEVLNISTPALPVNLTAAPLSTYEVHLSWTRSVSTNFATYRVYRATDASVDNTSKFLATIASQASTSYTDSSLDDATKYFYRVYVYDNLGLFAASNIDSATTLVNTPPEPVEFFVTNATDSTVELVWTPSEHHDFASYRIFRSDVPDVTTMDELVVLITNRSTTGYLYDPPAAGLFFCRIYVYDRHGAATGSSNSVLVQVIK